MEYTRAGLSGREHMSYQKPGVPSAQAPHRLAEGTTLRRSEAGLGGKDQGGIPSDGCSKPQSTMALRSSGFSRKSRKPELWMET